MNEETIQNDKIVEGYKEHQEADTWDDNIRCVIP